MHAQGRHLSAISRALVAAASALAGLVGGGCSDLDLTGDTTLADAVFGQLDEPGTYVLAVPL